MGGVSSAEPQRAENVVPRASDDNLTGSSEDQQHVVLPLGAQSDTIEAAHDEQIDSKHDSNSRTGDAISHVHVQCTSGPTITDTEMVTIDASASAEPVSACTSACKPILSTGVEMANAATSAAATSAAATSAATSTATPTAAPVIPRADNGTNTDDKKSDSVTDDDMQLSLAQLLLDTRFTAMGNEYGKRWCEKLRTLQLMEHFARQPTKRAKCIAFETLVKYLHGTDLLQSQQKFRKTVLLKLLQIQRASGWAGLADLEHKMFSRVEVAQAKRELAPEPDTRNNNITNAPEPDTRSSNNITNAPKHVLDGTDKGNEAIVMGSVKVDATVDASTWMHISMHVDEPCAAGAAYPDIPIIPMTMPAHVHWKQLVQSCRQHNNATAEYRVWRDLFHRWKTLVCPPKEAELKDVFDLLVSSGWFGKESHVKKAILVKLLQIYTSWAPAPAMIAQHFRADDIEHAKNEWNWSMGIAFPSSNIWWETVPSSSSSS